MLKALKKFDIAMHKLLRVLLIAVFALMTCVALLQIFFRFILGNPLTWTDEICRYCLVWLTLLGVGVAAERKTHISIDILCNALPEGAVAVLKKLWNVFVLIFCFFIIRYGIELAQLNMAQYSAGIHVKLGYFYYAVPISGVLMAYYNLIQLFGLDKRFAAMDEKV